MDALDLKDSSNIGGSFLCADCHRASSIANYGALTAGFDLRGHRCEICCRCTFCGANNTVARFASDPSGAEAVVRYT